MQYVMCEVWCVMCDVQDLIFCKIWTLWVKGRPKIPNLGNLKPLKWYSKIDPRWQSYVHYNLQGLLRKFFNLEDFKISSLAQKLSRKCQNMRSIIEIQIWLNSLVLSFEHTCYLDGHFTAIIRAVLGAFFNFTNNCSLVRLVQLIWTSFLMYAKTATTNISLPLSFPSAQFLKTAPAY